MPSARCTTWCTLKFRMLNGSVGWKSLHLEHHAHMAAPLQCMNPTQTRWYVPRSQHIPATLLLEAALAQSL